MRTINSRTRTRLLSSVCFGVIATTLATGAMAQDAVVSFSNVSASVSTSTLGAGNVVENLASVLASVDGAIIDNTAVAASGLASGTFNVGSNLISATALGTQSVQSVLLSNIENDVHDGAAASSLSLFTSFATSAVTASTIAVDIDGFASGSVSNSGNTVSALSQGNTTNTLLSGEIPTGYASTAPGSTSLDYPSAAEAAASGSLVATSAQVNTSGGHTATVGGNEITLDLTSAGPNTVTAGPSLDQNTISATLRGNNAQTTIDLDGGSNPTFTGSAVATNLQLNTSGLGAENVASNINSSIVAQVGDNNIAAVNTLNGGLSVTGNTISSRVAGNSALDNSGSPVGTQILIGDTLSISGVQPTGGSAITLDGGAITADVAATLSILNSQGNTGSGDFVAFTQGASVAANVQSLENGTINLSSNTISARASGNASTSAIISEGTGNTFDASAALASNQTNLGTDVRAENNSAFITATSGTDGGVTTGSAVSVNNNAITTTAFGNETGQTLSLNATNLNLDAGVATLGGGGVPDGNVSVGGAATVANLQGNYNSDVTATSTTSGILLQANSTDAALEDNAFQVTGNTQDVLAAGSSGSNTLSLSGNSVGGAAGLASIQVGNNSDVSATLSGGFAGITASTDVSGGSIDLSGNAQQARAFGTSASNTVSVTGTSAELFSSGFVGSSLVTGGVVSNYGLLNHQSTTGDVAASTIAGGALIGAGGFSVDVDGHLLNGNTTNDANSLTALAFGNQANNTTTLDVGTIVSDDIIWNSQVANALSVQSSNGSVSAMVTGDSVVNTYVANTALNSDVSTSGNLIQAQATANLASNATRVTATNLSTSQLANVDGIEVDAAFSVHNSQFSTGSVSATQLDDQLAPTQSANILTTIAGSAGPGIVGSTVQSDNNTSETRATGNSASNALFIEANSAATSSAVSNAQTNLATVSATMGIAGSAPVAPQNFSTGGGGSTTDLITVTGTNVTINAGQSLTIVFDETAAGGSVLADTLAAMGATVVGGSATFSVASTYSFANFGSFLSSNDGTNTTVSFSGFSTLGSPGVAPAGGVTISAEGDSVNSSTLSVAGNISRGSVTGNTAFNELSVEATSITGDIGTAGQQGEATHVLANDQGNFAALSSDVMATFQIETADGAAISGSTIGVSDNIQSATAVANTSQSVLSLGGASSASIMASSELTSNQNSAASVAASSSMQAAAAAAVTGSSLAIDGNRNTALAVANDATNIANVATTNAATAATVASNADLVGNNIANSEAENLVANSQFGTGSVTATADSSFFNQDLLAATTTGIANSSVSMSGNATVAEASSNRASNSMSYDAGATLGVNGGVMNYQASNGVVTASATSNVTLSLSGDPVSAALNDSSLAIEGNSTTALARGNFANNALNASAGAGYAGQVAGAGAGAGGSTVVSANYAVLNAQENNGAVNASSVGTSYRANLTGATSADGGISNGSVSVGGNQIASQAFGNQASNTLTLAGLNTTMPTAAIGSTQRNTADVTAMVSGASIGMSGTGTVGTSSLSVGGNAISASATGNSVTNRIAGN